MKTYARIQDGAVAELLIADPDITGRFNPALVWVDVSTVIGIAPGWRQEISGFAPPPAAPAPEAPTLAQLQAQVAIISAQITALSATN
jgi:hypothetical protein